jgi:alkylation response protein AidB-like acyl-CoA dehydrogenase
MDFRVSAVQAELADGVRTMLEGALPLEHLRRHEGAARVMDAADWALLGETGVFALTRPEPEGTGLGLAEAAVVFEELGRALVPGPLVGTFLAAHAGLVDGAAEGQAQVGLHGVAQAGMPVLVEHLDALDALVVVDGDGVLELVAPAPPVTAATRIVAPLCPLTPLWRLDAEPRGEPVADAAFVVHTGSLLLAALQVGHAAAAGELAVDYAKQRQQFGRPIGGFQAVQHLCADMVVRTEVARCAVHAAACLLDAPEVAEQEARAAGRAATAVVDRAVLGARLLADDAAVTNARAAIQVHGGMGFTWEVPLHLHLKRARVLATTLRPPSERAVALALLI